MSVAFILMVQIIYLNEKYNHIPASVNYQIPMLFRLPEGPLPYPRKSATFFNTESAESSRISYRKNKLDKNFLHNRAEISTSVLFLIQGLSLSLSLCLSVCFRYDQ